MLENRHTVERRKSPLIRAAWSLVFEKDRETLECMLLVAQVSLALTIVILNARIIAVPPPAIQGNVLTLPAWLWSGLLLFFAWRWCVARMALDLESRLTAVKWSFFVCCGLCGPLYLKALSFIVPMMVLVFFQCAVGVRLSELIRLSRSEGQRL